MPTAIWRQRWDLLPLLRLTTAVSASLFLLLPTSATAKDLLSPQNPGAHTTAPQESTQDSSAVHRHRSTLPTRYRLVNAREGRYILSTASAYRSNGDSFDSDPNSENESDSPAPPPTRSDIQDCSHVVHDIYRSAGYDYPYANSFDLYRGTPNFLRVKNPQPGDVIVWPGHVGIVLNARQHSFYSLVSTGFQSQKYTGAYWRGRGHPRFYRFLVEREAQQARSSRQVATNATHPDRNSRDSATLTTASAIEKDRRPVGPVQDASERTNVRASSPDTEDDAADREPPSNLNSSHGVRTAPVERLRPATEGDAVAAHTQPPTIVITTANARPSRDEVTHSLLAATQSAAESLTTSDPLQPATPIIIFEQLAVERVDTKNDRGWAQLKIDSRVSITREGVDFKRRHEKVRWELRRTDSGWEAVVPTDRVYVPRDPAAHALAAHLAELTQRESSHEGDNSLAGQEARIANLLSALLEPR